MEEYLTKTVTKWNNKDYEQLYLVIGNESCDLDSAVCSLVYATFLHWRYEQIKSGVCTWNNKGTVTYKDEIFVPILNVDKDDYDLKTEVVYLLTKHGIRREHLVFRDDPNLNTLPPDTKVTLVDHHVLSKRDQPFLPYVVEVIDHRPFDESAWCTNKYVRCYFEAVGSCSTMVAERIRSLAAIVSNAEEFYNAYPVCAILIHATIILDTVNFLEDANKGTRVDEFIVMKLDKYTQPKKSYCKHRSYILKTLSAAKRDISGLSTAQILRKDTKIVGDVLVASLPLSVEEFLERPDVPQATTEALTRNECSLALIMGIDVCKLQKDIAIFSNQGLERAVLLSQYIQHWEMPIFQLVAQTTKVTDCIYFKQQNFQLSRKQYVPVVTRFTQSRDKTTG